MSCPEGEQAPRFYEVTVLVRDNGADGFWRKARDVGPEERLADYVSGLLEAGEAITKFGCERIEVRPAAAAVPLAKDAGSP